MSYFSKDEIIICDEENYNLILKRLCKNKTLNIVPEINFYFFELRLDEILLLKEDFWKKIVWKKILKYLGIKCIIWGKKWKKLILFFLFILIIYVYLIKTK